MFLWCVEPSFIAIALKEQEKVIKYEKVCRERLQCTGYQAVIIPYVIPWDGNVSGKQEKIILGISDTVHSADGSVARNGVNRHLKPTGRG